MTLRFALPLLATALLAAATQASAQPKSPSSGDSDFQAQFNFRPEDRKAASFELFHGLILFKAQIEGREVLALLDNGADRTLIDLGYARSQGLKVSEPIGELRTATGSLERRVVSGVDVLIPGQVNLSGAFGTADLSAMSRGLGRPISLVVGKELFLDMAVVIKPAENSFEFWPSAALSLPPEAPRLLLPADARELVLKNDAPQLDILIAGRPAVLTVDLGSNDALALSEAAWSRLGLDSHATTQGLSMGAEGQPVATRATIVSHIRLGPIRSFEVPVSVKPVLPGVADGLIGMGFLANFNFAIDLKARRLWLISRVTEKVATR